ncbi:MAG: sialate O-acetylesterase [Lentisphaeria bacterium]|nr:sialate O-acetylesterase [Lentisphaeria bacterium]
MKQTRNRWMILLPFVICCVHAIAGDESNSGKKPLKVFILSGQSNMVGPAAVTTFPHIGMDPTTAPMLEKMVGPDSKPHVLDDVYIASIQGTELDDEKTGKLEARYGASKLGPKIGPEYTFGIYMHEALQEPILLIKTAWGGKSLNYHFRPPSAGEWTPPPGHPDLMVGEEDKPEPLPVPKSLELPVGYKPGKEYLNPYASLPGFFLGPLKGLRGCEIGEHKGVHPIYVCQDIREEKEGFPLKTGDLILGLNGEGMPENPKDFWRKVVYDETRKKQDWTIMIERWRDGRIERVSMDMAALMLPGGKAGIPKWLENQKQGAVERKKNQGSYYQLMISYVKKVLGDINRVYPDYDPKQGYEIAGFVWFQGWNDMVDSGAYPSIDEPRRYEQYSWLLRHFIRDIRKDLKAPDMPFVIGVLGISGHNEGFKSFRDAQAAPARDPEFKGTVKAVQTADYWDTQLDRLNKIAGDVNQKRKQLVAEKGLKGEALEKAMAAYEATVWTPEEKEIQRIGASNQGFHYLGSSKMIAQFGKAFAEAMLELQDGKNAP